MNIGVTVGVAQDLEKLFDDADIVARKRVVAVKELLKTSKEL